MCSDHVDIQSIVLVIVLVAHGKMSKKTREIARYEVLRNETFVKDKLHEIPFALTLKDTFRNSYVGKNVNFDYSCKVEIDVTDRDIEKIERSVFTKIKSFVTSDDTITGQRYFQLNRTNGSYKVVENSLGLDFQTHFVFAPLTLIALAGLASYFFLRQNPVYIVSLVVFFAALVGLFYEFLRRSAGKASMQIVDNGDSFFVRLNRSSNFNLSNQKLYYNVYERVIDRRGTSSSTYRSKLYTSSHFDLSNYDNETAFEFLYPELENLESFDFDDATIYWQMNLSGKYYGIPLKFKSIFEVRRLQLLAE